MIYIKQLDNCEELTYNCKEELSSLIGKIRNIEQCLDELSIVEHNECKNDYTHYEYFKYGNGILFVFGDSIVSRSKIQTIATVSFPAVSFCDIGNMCIQLTPQRNATLLSKLAECDYSGNRIRTESSFVVLSEGAVSEYYSGFSFSVIGHWK